MFIAETLSVFGTHFVSIILAANPTDKNVYRPSSALPLMLGKFVGRNGLNWLSTGHSHCIGCVCYILSQNPCPECNICRGQCAKTNGIIDINFDWNYRFQRIWYVEYHKYVILFATMLTYNRQANAHTVFVSIILAAYHIDKKRLPSIICPMWRCSKFLWPKYLTWLSKCVSVCVRRVQVLVAQVKRCGDDLHHIIDWELGYRKRHILRPNASIQPIWRIE